MKRMICALLALLLLAGAAGATETADGEEWEAVEAMKTIAEVEVNVPSAILIERETGTVLYEHDAHKRLPPASVTKIMTLLLAAEAIEAGRIALSDSVSASTEASGMGGSQIFLREGETMSVDELIKSVAVASANDAAVALAEHIAGSEGEFVALMNKRAAELGMTDTVFSSCTGLPCEGEHLTSAWDIALMSRALLGHEMIRSYTTIWTDSVRGGEFGLANTNKLIRFYPGATGLKTGFTQEAMYCLSASAQRDGTEYIAVIMHAPSSAVRFESAKILLNYAFASFKSVDIMGETVPAPVRVSLGESEFVQPVPAAGGKLILPVEEASGVTRAIELPDMLVAPVAEGQELGRAVLYNASGEELGSVSLVADHASPRLGFGSIFLKYLSALCPSGL